MFINFTAKYTKIPSGYLGQLIEWPEVVTEGKDLEDCRAMLRDALNQMILAYRQQAKEIPLGQSWWPARYSRLRQVEGTEGRAPMAR